MEAIILAGGFGTRLSSIVKDLPKPMAPVNGKPFMTYLLGAISKYPFTKIIISVGHLANKIEDYFGSHYEGIEIVYSKELEPLGTGGAIRLAMNHCTKDHVYVFNGDTYLDVEILELERLWSETRRTIIVVKKTEDVSRYGRIIEKNGKIIKFEEKKNSTSGLINAGCYVLNTNKKTLPALKNFSIEKDYFEIDTENKNILLYKTTGFFIDIGMPEDYKKSEEYLGRVNE